MDIPQTDYLAKHDAQVYAMAAAGYVHLREARRTRQAQRWAKEHPKPKDAETKLQRRRKIAKASKKRNRK